ncbi:MAG: hypothetical protein HC780_12190 [Leptolyngbyaceae cyanobacterium CSU_1_3]|nr:hypothetical protein [Leptolyngbyaceae cyanobacterium CSU_1_3]
MAVPSLGKCLLPAALVSGAVFSVLTAPLALFGSEPITVEMKGSKTEVFSGSLKDVAAPYLGLAGILSIGMGLTGVALAGWRQSSRQSGKLAQQVSGMKNQLMEKENQIQGLLFSDRQLETSGLHFFLDDEVKSVIPTSVIVPSQPEEKHSVVAQPIVQTDAHVAQPIVFSTSVAPSRPALSQSTVQAAVSPLSAAQSFLSFSRTGSPASAAAKPAWTQVTSAPSEGAVAQISELQTQLQQIMTQIETLQTNVWLESQSVLNQRVGIDPMIAAIPHAKQRLQKAEPQRVMQIVAS